MTVEGCPSAVHEKSDSPRSHGSLVETRQRAYLTNICCYAGLQTRPLREGWPMLDTVSACAPRTKQCARCQPPKQAQYYIPDKLPRSEHHFEPEMFEYHVVDGAWSAAPPGLPFGGGFIYNGQP